MSMVLPMARMLARRLACVRMTPLGSPVEPEVYWRKAMSEGMAEWKWRVVGRISVSGGAVEAAESEREEASRTARREGTRLWRILASEAICWKTMRNFASALRRMAA